MGSQHKSDPMLPSREALKKRPLVSSTLDLEIQHVVALRALQAAEGWRASGAGNVAVLVVERRTGNVLAHVGSADWFDAAHAGAIQEPQIHVALDRPARDHPAAVR